MAAVCGAAMFTILTKGEQMERLDVDMGHMFDQISDVIHLWEFRGHISKEETKELLCWVQDKFEELDKRSKN
ncbi:MAG: hypothetical protein DRI46_10480 [Chloroflexi bacterium]|nr:MAG: hypothetical protein DRI46_10480 [Chloroflexota bacterium]